MTWFKTIKGRGYIVTGYKSHGTPHKLNSELFWQLRQEFAEKYGAHWIGDGRAGAERSGELRAQFEANLKAIADTITSDDALVDYLADRLVELGDSVPEEIAGFRLDTEQEPVARQAALGLQELPEGLVRQARHERSQPRRARRSGAPGSTRSVAQHYGRPLFLAMSADLAESTNIAGFADGFGDDAGLGPLRPRTQPRRRAAAAGDHRVHQLRCRGGHRLRQPVSPKPLEEFDGFYSAHSTYASFSYLKYGLMRLFSQIAQDSDIKVGKVLWVAGHSGPETAEDSRTHFGIYETGVMQLFPEGHVINLIPWEHNEVPVLIAAAMATDAPHRGAAPDPPADPGAGPRGAGHGLALRGGAGRVPDPRLQARPAADGHDPGAGHDVHLQHGAHPAEARRARAERQAGRGASARSCSSCSRRRTRSRSSRRPIGST